MAETLLFIVLGVLATGLLLIFLGRRGLRLNDHPVCAGCGFDLHGVFGGVTAGAGMDAPAASAAPTTASVSAPIVTCPECGAGLKRAKAVRTGVRKRLHSLVALGSLLILLTLLPLGAGGWAALTGANISKYKPLPLLLWEWPRSNREPGKAIVAEIYDRMLTGKLDEAQTAKAVAAALAAQKLESRPWDEAWGDVLERARLDERLPEKLLREFHENAALLKVEARPRVPAGQDAPVSVSLREARVGPSMQLMASVRPISAMIGGQPAKVRSGAPMLDMPVTLMLAGSKSQASMFLVDQQGGWLVRIPEDIPPGSHELVIDVGLSIQDWGSIMGRMTSATISSTRTPISGDEPESDGAKGAGSVLEEESEEEATPASGSVLPTWDFPFGKPKNERRIQLRTTIDVLPRLTDYVQVVAPTEQLTKQLAELLRPATLTLMDYGGILGFGSQSQLMASFSIASPPVPFAFDVDVHAGDKVISLGTLTSGREVVSQGINAMFGGGGETRTAIAMVPKLKAKSVTLVFTPNVSLAKRTLDLTSLYGGKVVIEDVEVTTNDMNR